MQENQILLHFEIAAGRHPDTAIAAQALIEWVNLVRATVASIDPAQEVSIQIVGVTPGSTRFPQLLKFLDKKVETLQATWDDYPYLKRIVAGSAISLMTATTGVVIAQALEDDEQVVQLSETDRALLKELKAQASQSHSVINYRKRFYNTIEQDPAITGVGVSDAWDKKPDIIIPSTEFAVRSGLWEPAEEAPSERPQVVKWDVVLLRPALVSTPQSWQFMKDGFKFSAKMHDANFLAAIKDGRIPLTLQEGVTMTVQIEYQERLVGQIWEPIANSRRIVKVISPVPQM